MCSIVRGLGTTTKVVGRLFTSYPEATYESKWGEEWAAKTQLVASPEAPPELSMWELMTIVMVAMVPSLIFNFRVLKFRGTFDHRTGLSSKCAPHRGCCLSRAAVVRVVDHGPTVRVFLCVPYSK